MVTNIYVKFNYDRLSIDKALGNFRKSDNNNNNNKQNKKSYVCAAWGRFPSPKIIVQN